LLIANWIKRKTTSNQQQANDNKIGNLQDFQIARLAGFKRLKNQAIVQFSKFGN